MACAQAQQAMRDQSWSQVLSGALPSRERGLCPITQVLTWQPSCKIVASGNCSFRSVKCLGKCKWARLTCQLGRLAVWIRNIVYKLVIKTSNGLLNGQKWRLLHSYKGLVTLKNLKQRSKELFWKGRKGHEGTLWPYSVSHLLMGWRYYDPNGGVFIVPSTQLLVIKCFNKAF